MYVAISAAIVLFAVIFVIIARSSGDGDDPGALPTLSNTSEVAVVSTDAISADNTEQTTPAATQKQTESESQTESEPIDYDNYTGVPYSGAADLSVLSKSVFIGDSRTKGLPLYTNIMTSGARVYANEGLSSLNIDSTKFVTVGEESVSALDALRADPDYDSVYISLGINEMGIDVNYIGSWVARYSELVDIVRQINPEAKIYLQAILPVSRERSASDEFFTKERIDLFNSKLLEIAKEKQVNYLNTDEMFTDFDGYLPEEGDAGDGIHVNKTYSEKWLTYIIEHRA